MFVCVGNEILLRSLLSSVFCRIVKESFTNDFDMTSKTLLTSERSLKQSLRTSLLIVTWLLCMTLTYLAASEALQSPKWQLWQSRDLTSYGTKLAPKINREKIAAEPLGKYANHSMLVSHRQGNGQVEVHETQADVFIVQSGEGVIVLGGVVIDGKPSAPGEVRGVLIKGGEKRTLGVGDIVHISAGVPHQFLVEAGKELTCVFVKVDETK